MDVDFGPSSAALSQASLAGTSATTTVPATVPPASAASSGHGQHLHQGQFPSDSDLYAIQQQYQQYQQYQYYQQQQQQHLQYLQQQQQLQYQQANYVPGAHKMRKRKAESQDNERLSKRLSLLNLGKSNSFLSLHSIHQSIHPSLHTKPKANTKQITNQPAIQRKMAKSSTSQSKARS